MSDKNLKLEYVYDKTTDWLKFAEAKNAAILAINSAILFGVVRLALSYKPSDTLLVAYITCLVILLLVSMIVALLSFIPRLEPPFWVSFPKKPTKINVLYFGHICTLTPKGYLGQLATLQHNNDQNYGDFEVHFANQIVVNSKITFIKYKQFNVAIWFTISALLTPLGAILIYKVKV